MIIKFLKHFLYIINLKKSVKNLKTIIINNKKYIKQIILSESFVDDLHNVPKFVEIDVKKTEKKDAGGDLSTEENWFIFGVPAIISIFVKSGCIIELLNGEVIGIKGI